MVQTPPEAGWGMGYVRPISPHTDYPAPCNPASLARVHPLLPEVRVTRSIITHKLLAIVLPFLDTFYPGRGMNELSEAASAQHWTPKYHYKTAQTPKYHYKTAQTPKYHYKTAQTKADKCPTSLSLSLSLKLKIPIRPLCLFTLAPL